MPQIQDYAVSDTNAPEPVAGSRPNTEEAGAIGRSIENIGEKVSQASAAIQARDAQKETSDAYVNTATSRTKYTQDLVNHVNDPDFDSQKFIDNFDQDMDQQRQNYQTARGQEEFNRYTARTKEALLSRAAKTQAQNAGYQAVADMQQGLNQKSATLNVDPSQWQDMLKGADDEVAGAVRSNPKLEGQQPVLQQHLKSNIAMAAIRGYINQDPGSEADGKAGAAQTLLDSGQLDPYLTPQQRQQAQREIDMGARASDAASKVQGRAQDKLDSAEQQALGNSLYMKMDNGTFKASDVNKATYSDGRPMDFQFKQQMIDLANKHAADKIHGEPQLEADLFRRINLPSTDPRAITDTNALRPYLGNGLSYSQYQNMGKMIDSGGLDPATRASEKQFLKQADSAILKTNVIGGGKDPNSIAKSLAFKNDYLKAKQQAQQNGTPVADLWDPTKPGNFVTRLNTPQYQTTIQDQMQAAQQAFQQNVVNAQAAKDPKTVRQPGESIQDFLKRQKGSK